MTTKNLDLESRALLLVHIEGDGKLVLFGLFLPWATGEEMLDLMVVGKRQTYQKTAAV